MKLTWPDDYINKVLNMDCLEVMRDIKDFSEVVIITDPPYPDYHTELYGYEDGIINFLKDIPCKQLVFWSSKVDFPLDYTAIHIWNKKTGVGSMYERIFERNGGEAYRVFDAYLLNSTVAANYNHEIFFNHPSQKPLKLMSKLIEEYSEPNSIIIDPFAGSGSTLVAAKQLGRNYIGIEISPKYVAIANERLRQDILL